MRTFPHTLVDKSWQHEQFSRPQKRPLLPMPREAMFKDELESMEETDTEKQFKKVNTGVPKKPQRYLLSGCVNMQIEGEANLNSSEQIEKYKKAYEMEKRRYCEERSRYLY